MVNLFVVQGKSFVFWFSLLLVSDSFTGCTFFAIIIFSFVKLVAWSLTNAHCILSICIF